MDEWSSRKRPRNDFCPSQGWKRPRREAYYNGRDPRSLFSVLERYPMRPPMEIGASDQLTEAVWSLHQSTKQSGQLFWRKLELWGILADLVGREWGCKAHVFGSTLSGNGSDTSDMDLCIFTRFPDPDIASILADLRRLIRRNCSSFIDPDIELVVAKVPILKMRDFVGGVDIDVCCNNPISVLNTHLLHVYCMLDWRVRPLMTALKTWARNAGINEAKNGTISSYTLSLMAIHYLQFGVTESGAKPVLPSLQKLRPDIFHKDAIISFTSFLEPPSHYAFFTSSNKMSLGELLAGFFAYYDKFDFAAHCGSVRTGMRMSVEEGRQYATRMVGLTPRQWSAYVCMEEPFDRSNAGRATCRRERFDRVLDELAAANENMNRGKRCIDCLLYACNMHT